MSLKRGSFVKMNTLAPIAVKIPRFLAWIVTDSGIKLPGKIIVSENLNETNSFYWRYFGYYIGRNE